MFQGRNILINYSVCTVEIALYPAHTHKKKNLRKVVRDDVVMGGVSTI